MPMGNLPRTDMDPFAKLLASHRSLTEDTWSLLADRGVNESTPLVLDYRFEAESRKSSEGLTAALVELSDEVTLVRSGSFFRPVFTITGTFQPRCFDKDSLVGWVEMMCLLGRQFDSYFDGFGTAVPESLL